LGVNRVSSTLPQHPPLLPNNTNLLPAHRLPDSAKCTGDDTLPLDPRDVDRFPHPVIPVEAVVPPPSCLHMPRDPGNRGTIARRVMRHVRLALRFLQPCFRV